MKEEGKEGRGRKSEEEGGGGRKRERVEVEVEGEGEGGDVVVDLYYCSSASRCCSKHGAQAVVDRYALLLVGFTLL